MISEELRESVLKWAKTQTEPFLTAKVFENVEEAETLKEASDILRKLFLSGDLARKKIDGIRYIYIDVEIAPFDFEKCSLGLGKKLSESVQDYGEKQQEIGIKKIVFKQQRKPVKRAIKEVFNVDRKCVNDPVLCDLLLSKEEPAGSAIDAPIESSLDTKEATIASIKPLEIPEEFTMTLQTPGGLKITITSGRVSA